MLVLQLSELEEFPNDSYNNSNVNKEKTKRWHDQKLHRQEIKEGQLILLFNSRLALFQRNLKSRWSSPFTMMKLHPYGAIELTNKSGVTFKPNVQHVKPFYALSFQDLAKIKSTEPGVVLETLNQVLYW